MPPLDAPPALEPPPAVVPEASAPAVLQGAEPTLASQPAGQVPEEILAEIRQSREMRTRRLTRRTPLHRMDAIRGIPLGDLILGVCGAMMALGVLGEWLSVVVDGGRTTYTGLDLALRLGHLETLLVLATGLVLMLAPLTRSGTVVPVIRARQAAMLLVVAAIGLMMFELAFSYFILAAAYGPVEGLFPSFISDMGPGYWLSLLGASLGLAALVAFRGRADEAKAVSGPSPPASGASAGAGPP